LRYWRSFSSQIPCTFPVSRENALGDWFRRTASTTKKSAQTDVIS
jgi:hypothetical protein